MLTRERESRIQGARFVSFVAGAQKEGGIASWESVITLLAPRLLLCKLHPDQSEVVRSQEGFMELFLSRSSLFFFFFIPHRKAPPHCDASFLFLNVKMTAFYSILMKKTLLS